MEGTSETHATGLRWWNWPQGREGGVSRSRKRQGDSLQDPTEGAALRAPWSQPTEPPARMAPSRIPWKTRCLLLSSLSLSLVRAAAGH